MGKRSQLKAICSVVANLKNGLSNNLLEFHFHRQPKQLLFTSSTKNALLEVTNKLLFQVSTRSFLCTRITLLNIGRVTRKFSRLAKAPQQFLCQQPLSLLSHSRETQKMSFVSLVLLLLLCCLLATKQLYVFLHDFTAE